VGSDTSQAIRDALLRHPGAEVEIDLDAQSIVLTSGQRYDFEIDSFVKTMFMEGISEIDYTLKLLPEIEAKEAKLRNAYPWFYKVFK
jgi:3-isopropylmalate/(R)-2-methylmalate dehydratase small subunit